MDKILWNKILIGLLTVFVPVISFSQHHHHANTNDSTKKSANAYMHKSSTAELIKNFESKERDDYQQPEKVIDFLGDIEGKTIIDIGAGSGYFSVKLAEKGANVIAADVNDDFQNYLKKRVEENHIKNIQLRKIPFDSPNLSINEVDIAFIVNTYHHIENRIDYFQKVKSGLKENGELVIVDFFKTEIPVGPPIDHKIDIDTVVDELKKAGYTIIEINVTLLPYQYIIKAK